MRALRPLQPRWEDGVLHLAVRDDGRFTAGPANLQVAADELRYEGRSCSRDRVVGVEVRLRSGEEEDRARHAIEVHIGPPGTQPLQMYLPMALTGAALELARVLEQWCEDDALAAAWGGPAAVSLLVPSLDDPSVRKRLRATSTVEGMRVPCAGAGGSRAFPRWGCWAVLAYIGTGVLAWYASFDWVWTGHTYEGAFATPVWMAAWVVPQVLVLLAGVLYHQTRSRQPSPSGSDVPESGLLITQTGLRLPSGTRVPWNRLERVEAFRGHVVVHTREGRHVLRALEGRSAILAAALEGLRRGEVEEVPPELQRLAAAVARRTE